MRKRLIETVPLSGLAKVAKLDGQDVKQLREVARLMLEALESLEPSLYNPFEPDNQSVIYLVVMAAIQKAREIL